MKKSAGYSRTPLAKKLGIKEGHSILVYKEPSHYWSLFEDLPENISVQKKPGTENVDFIHIFCTSIAELHDIAKKYKAALKKDGMLWASWPKGSSKIDTDLKREPVRDHLLSIGLVDIKVAAVDENWSGLKFVYRLKDRK
ncbi:hypothetical protein HME9304_03132 [Flagellimonas maritima]|uniref:DUF3052 domain-containing protein n=1 Tax=Flagellimonas maritima TaxID=1383885 RepID=A0A2Z4LWL1_9FLAO|nr:DUF3052 domain-containing protein [Allomuricauda aurantiaca]AWX46100.1 hypothetical protein HME9304_03132 [Allomuricauda aurantiaca]